jgi:ribosomal protein S18 acetylase RimI-like enzyme
VRGAYGLLGYAVLKTLHTGEDGFVLDLMVLPGHREVARALLRESVRYFRDEGAHIIRYRYMPSPASPAQEDLRRLGFFHRTGRRNWLLVRFADAGLHEVGVNPDNWSYNVGDGEATFWIR